MAMRSYFAAGAASVKIQLTEAFTDPNFEHFPRPEFHQLDFVILTLYHDKFKDLPVAFAPIKGQGHPGRNRQPGRAAPAAGRRIREICSCHLFL